MKAELPDELARLEQRARGLASRHQNISPTPRDTLAILMQEAEHSVAQSTTFGIGWRWLTAAAALIIVAAVWFHVAAKLRPADVETAVAEVVIEPGIDLAEWDIEFDALLDEFDTSLGLITGSDSYDVDETRPADRMNGGS